MKCEKYRLEKKHMSIKIDSLNDEIKHLKEMITFGDKWIENIETQ